VIVLEINYDKLALTNKPRKVEDKTYIDPEVISTEQYADELISKMKSYIRNHKKDFQQFYSPSDDIYGETRSGNDSRPSFSDLEALATERCGFGYQLTRVLSEDAIRNGFEFVDYEGNVKPKKSIFKWTVKSDFYNQFGNHSTFDRTYGISFMMKYWSKNDKYDLPAPKSPPIKFQAFPPTILTPVNLTDTNMLDYDSDIWEFQGGLMRAVQIHRSRIHVLCTRPVPWSWIGLSVFEPIYLSASAYLNLIINGTKMLAKYGNVVTAFTMNEENPSLGMYQEYEELINEFKAAYTFILGKGEEINFQDTKMGSGLQEFAEFLKEDISSGSGIPLNQLFGRAVSGGIGGAGALTAERGKIQTISNIQHSHSDDVWKIINDCGYNLDGLMVRFRLDLQKTEMAKLEERQMTLQNFILEEQLKGLQLQNMGTAMQMQAMQDNPEMMLAGPDGQGQLEDKSGKDKSAVGGNGKQGNPADKTKHAMGGGRQNATSGQEKASLTGMMRRNQDFLNNNIYTYNQILNQFKKRKEDN